MISSSPKQKLLRRQELFLSLEAHPKPAKEHISKKDKTYRKKQKPFIESVPFVAVEMPQFQ